MVRVEPGHDLEEAHMRNRQLIARWALVKGSAEQVVELVKKEGKTYVKSMIIFSFADSLPNYCVKFSESRVKEIMKLLVHWLRRMG